MQYFTAASGQIESFNAGDAYFRNMDYAICIRRDRNACRIRFRTSLWELGITDAGDLVNGDQFCTEQTDYMLIPQSLRPIGANTVDRFCGDTFTSSTDPDATDSEVVSEFHFGLGGIDAGMRARMLD